MNGDRQPGVAPEEERVDAQIDGQMDRGMNGSTNQSAAAAGVQPDAEWWDLRLYVAGQTDKSIRAITNLTRICREHLEGRYTIEVIDLIKTPGLAADDHILALPTLVRRLPEPIRKIIGDLSNEERVIIGLDVRRRGTLNMGGSTC